MQFLRPNSGRRIKRPHATCDDTCNTRIPGLRKSGPDQREKVFQRLLLCALSFKLIDELGRRTVLQLINNLCDGRDTVTTESLRSQHCTQKFNQRCFARAPFGSHGQDGAIVNNGPEDRGRKPAQQSHAAETRLEVEPLTVASSCSTSSRVAAGVSNENPMLCPDT